MGWPFKSQVEGAGSRKPKSHKAEVGQGTSRALQLKVWSTHRQHLWQWPQFMLSKWVGHKSEFPVSPYSRQCCRIIFAPYSIIHLGYIFRNAIARLRDMKFLHFDTCLPNCPSESLYSGIFHKCCNGISVQLAGF